MAAHTWLWLSVAVAAAASGCDKKAEHKPEPSIQPSASAAPKVKPVASARSTEGEEPDAASAVLGDAGAGELGELNDVGPAAPASASDRGVVLITKDDRAVLAALDKKGDAVAAVKDPASSFTLVRGPAVAGEYAYWISKGRLVRRAIGGGPLEELTAGARTRTRVSAVAKSAEHPAAAAYISEPAQTDGGLVARVWVDGASPMLLTPEGSAASTVSLIDSGDELLALSLEGRTGMTPVHARRITFDGKTPKLHDDVVVWVGGPAQPLTEIAGGTTPLGDVWALLPLERDITRFGLAQIHVGAEPTMGAPVTWRAFPNGLDPAPVATAKSCGKTLAVYARPSGARPHAPQELHLATIGASGLGPTEIVARSSAFANVSLAAVTGGTLVSYVADFRTWARVVRCAPPKATK